MLKIKRNNSKILEQVIDSNEKLIYSSQPYYKEIKIIDSSKSSLILTVLIPLILTILISVILFVWGQLFNGILAEFTLLPAMILIVGGTLAGWYLLDFFISITRNRRLSLKNTEYFITDHRIIAISPLNDNEDLIIILTFKQISDYYIKIPEKKPFSDLFFKTEIISDVEMDNCFITAKQVVKNWEEPPSQVCLENQRIFKLPEKQFILVWKNIQKSDKIPEMLSHYLPNKQIIIPIDQSKIMKIEAHIGG